MKVHEDLKLFSEVLFISGVDEFDMIRLHNRIPSSMTARMITVTDFEWLLDIFDNDWRLYRYDRGHSFVFSLDFMAVMEPLLKRTDIKEIVLLEKYEYA